MLNRKLAKLKAERYLESAIERSDSGDIIGIDLQNGDLASGGCNLEAEIKFDLSTFFRPPK